MQNVNFKDPLAPFAADAKKSNDSKLYSVHNGSIYGASRIENT